MFFNERLMCRGGRVHETWVCACARDSSVIRVDYTRRPIHDICVDIKRWVLSRSENPRRRLSLRTSATLVAGAATAYRMQLDDLYSGKGHVSIFALEFPCPMSVNVILLPSLRFQSLCLSVFEGLYVLNCNKIRSSYLKGVPHLLPKGVQKVDHLAQVN
ncbi:hypothetical protein EVAR_12070_1 [Eumeta japonica]|uniref:Rad21/Rec8-like protein N-terminal domain-containing protein n=1 Tax=Eumeta variegata TaxID=151549 RepID=A0A4C1U591_EUMVA|nr:hypothetical protein EVAR_12070_1 [Eumeta japonica]